ncbi:AAA family ATPase [Streptosporangium sandarakinum]|uniref:AAA family ATPase n=1 Tax=Streptosporangium sandarakinum TaxID=1260955 RepID=UPI0033ABBF48
MIIWLNGTFGAGKTTTAGELVKLVPDARLFDPEVVGFMLRYLKVLPEVPDFQQWPAWRDLVVETAVRVLDHVGGVLVAPQTVLVKGYWAEIRDGLGKAGVPVRHFLLHADEDTLIHRIETDTVETGARQWRLDHLPRYRDALPWLRRAAEVVDTTGVAPERVARLVASAAGYR